MPVVLTAADVELYAELSRRLTHAATTVAVVGSQLSNLVSANVWTGFSASAARAEANRLAARLTADANRVRQVSTTAVRATGELAAELMRRKALEAAVRNELGRLAALPGDVEARAREEVERLLARHAMPVPHELGWLRRALPVSGHELWADIHLHLHQWLP